MISLRIYFLLIVTCLSGYACAAVEPECGSSKVIEHVQFASPQDYREDTAIALIQIQNRYEMAVVAAEGGVAGYGFEQALACRERLISLHNLMYKRLSTEKKKTTEYKLALKQYHLAWMSAMRAAPPLSGETKRSYKQRLIGDELHVSELWNAVELEN